MIRITKQQIEALLHRINPHNQNLIEARISLAQRIDAAITHTFVYQTGTPKDQQTLRQIAKHLYTHGEIPHLIPG